MSKQPTTLFEAVAMALPEGTHYDTTGRFTIEHVPPCDTLLWDELSKGIEFVYSPKDGMGVAALIHTRSGSTCLRLADVMEAAWVHCATVMSYSENSGGEGSALVLRLSDGSLRIFATQEGYEPYSANRFMQ